MEAVAARIRTALNARDMSAFRQLIAEDATWGEGGPDDERTCHNRNDIVATYKRLLAEGVRGTVGEATIGPRGIACHVDVEWPDSVPQRPTSLYQVFFVRDGLITRIVGYDDRDRALASIAR